MHYKHKMVADTYQKSYGARNKREFKREIWKGERCTKLPY